MVTCWYHLYWFVLTETKDCALLGHAALINQIHRIVLIWALEPSQSWAIQGSTEAMKSSKKSLSPIQDEWTSRLCGLRSLFAPTRGFAQGSTGIELANIFVGHFLHHFLFFWRVVSPGKLWMPFYLSLRWVTRTENKTDSHFCFVAGTSGHVAERFGRRVAGIWRDKMGCEDLLGLGKLRTCIETYIELTVELINE